MKICLTRHIHHGALDEITTFMQYEQYCPSGLSSSSPSIEEVFLIFLFETKLLIAYSRQI